jgi:hypothetical protein
MMHRFAGRAEQERRRTKRSTSFIYRRLAFWNRTMSRTP